MISVVKGVTAQTARYDEYFNLITTLKRQAQPPTVNSGTVYPLWSKENVIDGEVGGADICSCCAVFLDNNSNWVELVFTQTYTISRIIVHGRPDKPNESMYSTDMHEQFCKKHILESIAFRTILTRK